MASNVLRTCGLLFYFVVNIVALMKDNHEPWIQKLEVLTKDCVENSCKYLLNAHGGEFLGHNSWRLTSESGIEDGNCDAIYPNYELREISTLQWVTKIEVTVPKENGKIYFCLRFSERNNSPFGGKWSHQGAKIFLAPKIDGIAATKENLMLPTTQRQKEKLEDMQWVDLSHDIDVNYLPPIKRATRKDVNDVEVFDDMVNILEGIVENDGDSKVFNDRKRREVIYNGKDCLDKGSSVFEDKNSKSVIINDDNSTEKYVTKLNQVINDIGTKLDVVSEGMVEEIVKTDNRVRNNGNAQGEANNDVLKVRMSDEDGEVLSENYNKGSEEILNINKYENNNVYYNGFHVESNVHVGETTQSGVLNDGFNRNRMILDTKSANSKEVNRETDLKRMDKENIAIIDQKEGKNEVIDKETHRVDNLKRHKRSNSMDFHNTESANSKGVISETDLKRIGKEDRTNIDQKEAKYQVIDKGIDNVKRYKRSNSMDFHSTKDIVDLVDVLHNNQSTVPDHSDGTSLKTTIKPEDVPVEINIDGIRVEDSEKEPKIIGDGIPSVLADSRVTLRLFGDGLSSRTVIAFTNYPPLHGGARQPCKFLLKGEYMANPESLTGRTALFDIIAPTTDPGTKLYLCMKNLRPDTDLSKDEDKYLHQGEESYKVFATHNKLLPLWVTLSLILICLTFSALFSGLNLGLMSLDRTELKIISNTGTEQERKYARAIMPVRDHGNYLLCSILLGNVAVNSTFTILLDDLTSGLFAVIFSTLAIVLLGEITPQAICSRHGLMVGAKSIMVTKAVMALTAPLAFPISKLLDYFLGEEIGNVYNRERLKELVKVTTGVNDLDKDEVNIISGALELRKKTVENVMTKLEDVFMLPITSVLDFETMSEIIKSGYSRIPVYEGHRGNIVTVLFIKDLAFVDPDDNTPLNTLCQYYQNPCNFVFEDVTLDVMFKQFKDGHKGHMAFVHRINNEGEGDPFYETIGLVTLEDVIEEMIQAEIVDETDVFMDNRTKRRRNRPQHKLQDFAAFAERHENQRIHISPQLTLATFQFLSTSVDAFRPDTVSETVLRRLFKQDVIQYIKLKGKSKKDPSTYVFQQGKPVDYFVLILEGRVEVTVGRENLVFEAGPFTYFGVQALTQNIGVAESPTPSAMGSLQNINMDSMLRHTFVPDYSVRAITELYYLTVKRSLYLAAKRATLMEKGALSKGSTNEQFDTEVDKHLCNSTANIPISMISKKLLGKSTSSNSTNDADIFGSMSTGNKTSPRLNIIELLQITPQNYSSSERLEANSIDKHTTNASRSIHNCMPITNKSVTNMPTKGLMCDKHWQNSAKCLPNMSSKSLSDKYWANTDKYFTNACDVTKSMANCDTCWSNHNEFGKCMASSDANICDECVSNNYWTDKRVLNKNTEEEKVNDTDHSKRKKTTFHTDSSLLTFHDLSPDQDSMETRSEFERDTIDYDRERSRRNTDEIMLMQLDKIINLLQKKPL